MTNPLFTEYLRQRGVVPPAPRVPFVLPSATGSRPAGAAPFVLPPAVGSVAAPVGPFVLPPANFAPPPLEAFINGVRIRDDVGNLMLPEVTPWQAPPGYIPANPNAGAVVPTGGYQNVTPTGPVVAAPDSAVPGPPVVAPPVVVTTPAGPVVVPAPPAVDASGAPVAAPVDPAAQPPIIVDPAQTYAPGTAIPEGSVEAGWTPEGIRQVTTPDGAIRQVDAAGLLAGSGVVQPTEAITVLDNGVVQAPGNAGVAATPTEALFTTLTPEQEAEAQPFLNEMVAMGLDPQAYVQWQNDRATDAQATADQLYREADELGSGMRYGTPEQITETYARADAAALTAAGLRGDADRSLALLFPEVGSFADAATAPFDVLRLPVVTGVGALMAQIADTGSTAENVDAIAQWVNPLQSLMNVTFDPIDASVWATNNPDLVRAANENGYDADGDGVADYTGGRAVWELYVGTMEWYERAGADIALDFGTYAGALGRAGTYVLREAPGAARTVAGAVTGAADEVAPVVDEAVPTFDEVEQAVPTFDEAEQTVPTFDDVARTNNATNAVPTPAPTFRDVPPPTSRPTFREVVGGALQAPDIIINRGADAVVTGALGVAGDVVRNTPGLSWLARTSDRVTAETDRDETLAALDRTTALERRARELEAGRLAPGQALPGEAPQPATTTDAVLENTNPDALANRTYDAQGQHVDDVVDPLAARQADPAVPATPEPAPLAAVPEPVNPRLANEPRNELDRAFRDVASKPWAETVQERASLFRSRVINRRPLGDAPDEDAIERARSFIDLTESAWRRATQNNDTATLTSNSFRQWMNDADELHARVGRRGANSQNLPLAWERVPDASDVPRPGTSATPGAPLTGTATDAAPVAQQPNAPSITRTRLDQADLPLGERDRARLNEVLKGDSKVPQEPVWDRYRRHLADAEDLNMDLAEATEYAARKTGDDIMLSRGMDPKKTGKLGWWDNITGKIATGILYKPTTLIRRVIQDRIGDSFQLGVGKEFGALALANDPKLAAEGVRAQQGVRGADKAFGNSEASKIIGDSGLGTKFRGELTLANSRVDRAGGTVRQTELARRRQAELTQADTLAGKIWDRTKYYATGAPREIINGLGSTSRIGLYADKVREGLPAAVRAARERAAESASRYGFDADAALVDDAFAALSARQAETGARAFDAVQLREALRTSARTATADPSGAVSVGLQKRIDDWSSEVAGRYQDDLVKLDEDAIGRVNEVLFSYRPTNLDEAISKVVFFHYWSSRATKFYVTEGLKNPVLAANYFRAREGVDNEAENGDYPAPVRGFLKLLGTDGGYTLYWNPTALLQTYATFREAAGTDTDGRNWLERALEGEEAFGVGNIGMVNPLLQAGMDIVGLLPTGNMTDPLMTNTDRRLVGNAVNWARANGYLGASDTSEPLDAPYQRLLNEARSGVSGLLSDFLPGLARHVEANDPTANATRQLHDAILAEANRLYPDDPDRALDEASIAMFDPDSDLYQQGWENYTDAQLIQSGIQAVSPVPVQTRPTNADENTQLIDRTRELNPDLDNATLTASDPEFAEAQVERGLISEASPEAATLALDAERAGNVGTPEGRNLSARWSAISYGDATEVAAELPQGLTIGTTVYSPQQIAALPEETRMTLANLTIGSDPADAARLGEQRTARDAFVAGSPEYAAYTDWRNSARSEAEATDGADLIAWADRTAETNGTFNSWWQAEIAYIERTVTDPTEQRERLEMAALSTDAYTAYGGRQTDVFAPDPQPLTGPPTLPTGGEGAGFDTTPTDPRVQLDSEIAQYQADMLLVDTVLRDATGVPDISYADITMPGGQDVADTILARRGIEPPRMGRLLYEYATWVEDMPPGAPRDIDTFLAMQQTPATVEDLMSSSYVGP